MIAEINQIQNAFNEGAELWVVPYTKNSTWFKKLNWYCSSQLSFWLYKKQVEFAPQLSEIIKNEKMPFLEKKNEYSKNILVETTNIFPNKAVLAINVDDGLAQWLEDLKKKATSLGAKNIRIFWGQNQIQDFLKGLMLFKKDLNNFKVEVVTCDPDKL